jgi:hypothetical protein
VDVVDGNGEIRWTSVWVPSEIRLKGASAFLLASSVSKSHPKILTYQTKTLSFIWVLLNPFFLFFLPSSSHWVQIARQLQFFLTKHSIATSNKNGLQKNKNGFLSLCLLVNAEEQQ